MQFKALILIYNFLALIVISHSIPATAKPNVVVLFADDLGYQDIGAYGGPVLTPTLDRMARKGVQFMDFHSPSGVCSSSRAATLTGRHHIRAGVYTVIRRWHKMHLLESEVTLAELLKAHGYATVHIGKWHLGLTYKDRQKPAPDKHGFDYWFATRSGAGPSHKNPRNFIRNGRKVGKLIGYSAQILADEAISWLDTKRNPNQPFFLNVWFHEPHATLAAPDDIVAKYGKLKDPAAKYSGTIDNTDRAIARLLAKLKDMGVEKNTLVVYSSDNGSYRKERNGPLRGKKGSLFEGGHRVPGIFYWPDKITAGRKEHEPAGMIDLLPTVAGLIGIDPPKGIHLDGSDLTPLLTGRQEAFTRDQLMFWFAPGGYPTAAVRDGKYSLVAYRNYQMPRDKKAMAAMLKRINGILREANDPMVASGDLRNLNFSGKFKNKRAEKLRAQYHQLSRFRENWIPTIKAGGFKRYQLFDLEKDFGQKIDISREHPEIVARLKNKLLKIHASVMADGPDWDLKEK